MSNRTFGPFFITVKLYSNHANQCMEGIIMANKEKILAGLQAIVTDLAQQADGHAIQSRVFASMGFTKLADKYAEHATEERG